MAEYLKYHEKTNRNAAMNVAGQLLLEQLGEPLPLGQRVFPMGSIDWRYVNDLADRSPNGLSAYPCDLTMKLSDGSNDLRYPKFPAVHELTKNRIRKEISRLNRSLDEMGVPEPHKGVVVYGSMSDADTLYSVVGLRRVDSGTEYWGHGDLIIEVMNALRPSWDWQPIMTVSFPVVWGSIQLSQPRLLKGPEIRGLLQTLRSIVRCLVIRGTAMFCPSREFGFEAAVFTRSFQERAHLGRQYWFYDFYHLVPRSYEVFLI